MKVLLFLLMIVAAAVLGLAIAVWYLSRFVENGGPVSKPPPAVPFPEKHPPVDVTPKLTNMSQPPADENANPEGADVDGLMRRLAAIESEQEQGPAPAAKAADQQPQPLDSSRDEEKDDLKRISGIGPKLEETLNANGVFSFSQIAEWQNVDIEAMDERLPAFKGRVRRDDWVGQAKKLRDEKGSVF